MPPRLASRPVPPRALALRRARLLLLHPAALAARVCPCCSRLLLLLPASQGSTGDPRLLSRRKAIASQAPPSRGWHVASCRPVPPRAFAIHQNGTFGGRLPPHLGNLPGKGSFFRKVRRFSGGPSMLGVVFPEGPALFRGTFHARSHFPGKSCVFQGDLPCQEPFSRKVSERVGERVGEKDCTVAGMDPFLTIWHGNIGKKFDLAVWHRQKSMIRQVDIGKKNTIRQGDIGRKFVIPVEIDYFCIVSI